MKNQHHELLFLGLLTLVTLALFASPQPQLGALLLTGFLPGYALVEALHLTTLRRAERLLLSIAAGYGLSTVLIMGMAISGIPLTKPFIGGSLLLLTLGLIALGYLLPYNSPALPTTSPPRFYHALLIGVVCLAALFRFPNLPYSDYQGDEAGVLLQAVAVYQGDLDAIMSRFKGPGEVMLINAVSGLTDNLDETTTRAPFALAGTIAVGLIYLLGVRMGGLSVGLIAAALAIVEGVFVSYARTAQYQSSMLLLTLAAMLCFYGYTQRPAARLHALGTFLLSVGILFHFEALFFLPVMLILTLTPHVEGQTIKVEWSSLPPKLMPLLPSLLIFCAVTASFYIPFLLHPSIESTGTYLENRIGGGELPPFNNLDHFFQIEALKYNSLYYVALLNLSFLLIMIRSFQRSLTTILPSNRATWLTALIFLLTIGLAFSLITMGQYRLSAALLALTTALYFGFVILSPATPHLERTLWLWIAPAMWVYLFWVNRPGKHHYLVWSAVLLLIGWAVTETSRYLPQFSPRGRKAFIGGLIGLGGALWLIFAGHTAMVLLRNDIEYLLTYPAHKSRFYPTEAAYPYGSRIGFGYPYRLGWQTISQHRRAGQLEGTWSATDEGNSLTWYLLDEHPTACYPRTIYQPEIAYKGEEGLPLPFFPHEFGYQPRYEVWGNGRLRLTMLEFDPDGQLGAVERLDEAASAVIPVSPNDFPTLDAPPPAFPPHIRLEPAPMLGEGSELKQNAPPEYLERAQQLNGQVALVGYEVETAYRTMLPINLHWYTTNTPNLRYKVFIHLVGADGQIWAQADNFPVCGTSHVNSWPAGSTTLDRHLLKLPPDLPSGEYHMVIGMYEPELNLRLNYLDVAGNEQGNSFTVEGVYIR